MIGIIKQHKKILITGGAGFIGSNLAKKLLIQGHQVYILDNMLSGSSRNLKQLPKAHFTKEDVGNKLLVAQNFDFDEIYHLACPASPVFYQAYPLETIETCVNGAFVVLEIARRTGCKVLFSSTSEIYGDPVVHPQTEDYYGNVNCFGPRSCFSGDTEILTEEGWKFIKDLENYRGTVLTINKNHKIEYQKSTEFIKQRYNGQLIRFKNFQCDLDVTPNHKMYAKKRGALNFEFKEAFDGINWNRAKMLKTALYEGDEKKWFYFPKDIDTKNSKTKVIEKIKMDDWLEFFGYFVSEGCVYMGKKKSILKEKTYIEPVFNILISQSKEKNKEKYDKIEKCLKKMPFHYCVSGNHQFSIHNKQLANYLIRFGKSKEKYIPQELLNVSKRQLKILFDAMILGDGSICRGKRGKDGYFRQDKMIYYSSSYKLMGCFQELLLKLGMCGNFSAHDKRHKNIIYQLHIAGKKSRESTYCKREVIDYDGYVYCVTVPNHIIYVRRNGKALFCGNCYDEGKRIAETIFYEYEKLYGVNIRIARIFNTYGPNMRKDDGRVISNFIYAALKGNSVKVYGSGTQTRSFCYISDMVDGLIALMDSEYKKPMNLGNPEEYYIYKIADKIIDYIDSSSFVEHEKLPVDDPIMRCPDISLAGEILGWEPKVSFEEGIKKTIEYFKEIVREEVN